jgi:hypothetical protein
VPLTLTTVDGLFVRFRPIGTWEEPRDKKAEPSFHRTPLEIPNRLITTATAGSAVFATTTAAGGRSFFTRLGNIHADVDELFFSFLPQLPIPFVETAPEPCADCSLEKAF